MSSNIAQHAVNPPQLLKLLNARDDTPHVSGNNEIITIEESDDELNQILDNQIDQLGSHDGESNFVKLEEFDETQPTSMICYPLIYEFKIFQH